MEEKELEQKITKLRQRVELIYLSDNAPDYALKLSQRLDRLITMYQRRYGSDVEN